MNVNETTQQNLITALCKPPAYHHETTAIQLIETHISWVLLTGRYAYKIKKPVNFGFLDFSTLEKRRFYCQEELRLNRRLAADWYLEVVPITGQADCPKMDGAGEAIEYALKMLQFPSALTLKELTESGGLDVNEIDQITDIVASFHSYIEKAGEQSPYGESRDIKHWFDENFSHIRPLLKDGLQLTQLEAIQTWSHAEWANKSPLIQQRKQQGYVRECHGDLHLANMTVVNDRIVLFDCIEFNAMLRWVDVISEVAFLVMDLIHMGYESFAYRFLNHYLQHTGDYGGLTLLRYYLVYRALVRAKVAILRSAQSSDTAVCAQARTEYEVFANIADRLVKAAQHQPVLIITHGFSGSGKSTLASQLAERIGAIQIRSDIERKRLFGHPALKNTASAIDNGIYTRSAAQKTYQYLAELAKPVLKSGWSTIIDATFLKVEQRNLFRQLARECQVKFVIIDFQVSDEMLQSRIRLRKNDASEATIDVLHQQQQSAEPLSLAEQKDVISFKTSTDNMLKKVLIHLENLKLPFN